MTRTVKNIDTYAKAWSILHALRLEGLMAGKKPDYSDLSLTDLLNKLLINGMLIDLLIAITEEKDYTDEQNNHIDWKRVDLAVIRELVLDFFAPILPIFSTLLILQSRKSPSSAENANPVNPSK